MWRCISGERQQECESLSDIAYVAQSLRRLTKKHGAIRWLE